MNYSRQQQQQRFWQGWSRQWFRGRRRPWLWALLAALISIGTIAIGTIASPSLASLPSIVATLPTAVSSPAADPEQQGRERYAAGQFREAIALFQQALERYAAQGDRVRQAMVRGNLALAYQQLGEWESANTAITTALAQLDRNTTAADQLSVLAQALDIQGHLYLEQGQAELALNTWEEATTRYRQLQDESGILQSQIHQAQALQIMGLYRRAIDILNPLQESLQAQPDSLLKAMALRTLGDALQVAETLDNAQTTLQESLAVAERLQNREASSAAQLSLGNVARALGQRDTALALYRTAAQESPSTLIQLQANLNILSLLLQSDQDGELSAQNRAEAQQLWQQIQSRMDTLPASRTLVYARVNLAKSLTALDVPRPTIAEVLAVAVQQAHALGDRRAESYALGSLGTLYEESKQWVEAQQLTEQALLLAQTSNASDVSYRWQWQLGRLLKAQNKDQEAIAAYDNALKTLKVIRADLVAVNPEVQFSFQDSVEPIHREMVSLLLQPVDNPEAMANQVKQARDVIESLQRAELENFFREACLDVQTVNIDTVDPQAAIIYPILLPERLAVIVSVPQQQPRYYDAPVSASEMDAAVSQFRRRLTDRRLPRNITTTAKQFYDWLIAPAADVLATAQVKTLVFVLDGPLRNVPMGVLYNGDRYLIEDYSIAVTPGLQLLTPQRLAQERLSVLAAGLTEGRQGFSPLPNVENELKQIGEEVPTQVLLNDRFTQENFQQALASSPAPIIHLATHGEFSSQLENTFVLTWVDRININQLSSLLQDSDLNRRTTVELLVLSACKTASGDRRAALGLAGIAVRAGARSTVASLWSVDDQATSQLMIQFYDELLKPDLTKAEALRQAQLTILNNPQYQRQPFYWAPFVLVGNWL